MKECCCCICSLYISIILLSIVIGAYVHLHRTKFAEDNFVDRALNSETLTSAMEMLGFESMRAERPGLILQKEGVTPHYPVVFIPGIVSTGLEVWQGKPCAKNFREKFWGSSVMVEGILLKVQCWLEHMKLNQTTGLDPEGIKVRAVRGLAGSDYLLPGYWIWSRMIENFADIGYDENNLYMATYDWRLSYHHLEERDHYFSNLKMNMEAMTKNNGGRPCVIVTHSMGTPVTMHFLKWVESDLGGKGGKDWVSKHVKALMSIGGVFMGVPKSFGSLMSGETKDTAMLDATISKIKDAWLPAHDLTKFFHSLGSVGGMLPKGGKRIWGDVDGAPDDRGQKSTFGTLMDFNTEKKECNDTVTSCPDRNNEDEALISDCDRFKVCEIEKFNVDDSLDLLRNIFPKLMKKNDDWYDFGFEDDEKKLRENEKDPRKWTNPTLVQLPNAPNFEIYCMYGIGFETERAYVYTPNPSYTCENDLPFILNTSYTDKETNYQNGVQTSDGDGTVPLISLSFPCVNTWQKKKYNPHGVKVVVREFEQENISLVEKTLRYTTKATEHVDIIGNYALIEDVLRVASNTGEKPQERIFSKAKQISERFEEREKYSNP
eukprot:TRINITY_DN3938_c0_g1_i1.p1 TRINITY_DN3938_c0_g1~~TRINITY_DN3938_c0_g1_i1.p1  ORF type:complete len:664 (-),score=144.14 TRINITY_DN3938_c0_g1_i1:554-2362(-)